MTDQNKAKKAEKQVENLELNKETLQDLTELETEAAKGGQAVVITTAVALASCKGSCAPFIK
jgi:hypothetical protein